MITTYKELDMKLVHLIPIVAVALVLVACGGAPAAVAPAEAPMAAPAPINQGLDAAAGSAGGATAPEQGNAASGPAAQANQPGFQRLVIKTADLELQVANARDAEASLRALVGKLGGYVVKVETSGTDERMASRVTFRVPAERFDEALSGAQGLAQKVLARTVSGDDVTEEFVDLESRLKNLEATRDRLLTFLEKADKVEDALKVNESLSQIQGEIEQARGRKQFLQQSAALSTISAYLTPEPITPLVAEEGWQPINVARGALRGLISFGQGLASIVIVAVVWAPVWLPLLLAGWWLRRRLMRPRAPAPTETV
jgi:hypothetical protein